MGQNAQAVGTSRNLFDQRLKTIVLLAEKCIVGSDPMKVAVVHFNYNETDISQNEEG